MGIGILQDFLVEIAASAALSKSGSLLNQIRSWFRTNSTRCNSQQLQQLMHDLGLLTEEHIRKFIEDFCKQEKLVIPKSNFEELVCLLHNMARSSRTITTQGTPRSSYLRCEHLLEQLLQNIQPARKAGEQVGPGYEWVLERFLGNGAFGEVWMCRNIRDTNMVRAERNCRAFKFFSTAHGNDWITREENNLFEVLDKLPNGHANIVKFHSVSVSDQQYPLLEFEYVAGGSLEEWIVEDKHQRASLDITQTVQEIVAGLAAAHQAGIYHRDVKPANVLLTDQPKPIAKITDFGLATIHVQQAGGSAMVSNAAQVGTRMYIPPEALKSFASVDPAKQDVFAIGVLWYQLCVNDLERPPYNFKERLADCNVDSNTIRLICQCLAHPDDRFANCQELRDHLVDVVPPTWEPPQGRFDVQHIFREYLASSET